MMNLLLRIALVVVLMIGGSATFTSTTKCYKQGQYSGFGFGLMLSLIFVLGLIKFILFW